MVQVSFPGKTQTMVRVNCQNGDGGGSWVGEERRSPPKVRVLLTDGNPCQLMFAVCMINTVRTMWHSVNSCENHMPPKISVEASNL